MSLDNLNTYNSSDVVNWYKNIDTIVPVEKFIFEMYKNTLLNGSVLDIGIGAGRTTKYLLDKCKNYTSIDYSEKFVSTVKKLYPKANVSCMDARDLSDFKDNSFDFVNFSFNGIDYVNLDGREKIMREVNRVLKPGGIFFFSTHNKIHSCFNKFAWLNKENSKIVNIKTFIKLLPFLPKHLAKKKEEVHTINYAIINDSAHNYNLFTFYTSPGFLKTQLSNLQFASIELYLKDGTKTENNCDDWIFVTCKKNYLRNFL